MTRDLLEDAAQTLGVDKETLIKLVAQYQTRETTAALIEKLEQQRTAIAMMTDGDEATVEAIIRVAMKFVDDPDARILLRHVVAQGERLKRKA